MKNLQVLIFIICGSCPYFLASESKSLTASPEMNQDGKRERIAELKSMSPVLKKSKNREEEHAVHKAMQVAAYLITLDENETQAHSFIDPMKLQKLLYYVQGYSLALNNCPMFAEDLVHYTYGPVVWDVLRQFNGRDRISRKDLPSEDFEDATFSEDEIKNMETVFRLKMLKSAIALASDTHSEKPYTQTSCNETMPTELIKDSFKELESWLPYIIQRFIETNGNEDFENLVRYVREYISYGCFDIPTLENLIESFNCCNTKLEKALAAWTGIVNIKWTGQTYFQAFMGHLFFPVQYEYNYEIIREDSFQSLICISASFRNILAMYHATKLLELYSSNEESSPANSLIKEIFPEVSAYGVQEERPYYFTGLLCIHLNNSRKANELFKKGFESKVSHWSGYRYALSVRDKSLRAKIIEELKLQDFAVAKLAAATLAEDNNEKAAIYEEAGNLGIPSGYFNVGLLLAEKDSLKAQEMYARAAQNHIVTAYEKLAEFCKQEQDSIALEKIYESWGETGDPVGLVKLGELLLEKGKKKKAIDSFRRAGIRGIEKLVESADSYEERERMKIELVEYTEHMYNFIKLKLTSKNGSGI